MIHLFSKVYLSSDKLIDNNYDRVVISDTYGYPVISTVNLEYGELIGHYLSTDEMFLIDSDHTGYESWEDFFKKLDAHQTATGQKVMVYADDTALNMVLCAWLKLILPNSDKNSVNNLINALLFKTNAFYKGVWSSNSGNSDYNVEIPFIDSYDSLNVTASLEAIELFDSKMSVEYLLASYLANGSKKKELKTSMQILVRKDLTKYLIELKEIFFIHLLTKRFSTLLKFDQDYNMSNITEVVNDSSKFAYVFTSDRIWGYKYLTKPTGSKNEVILENIRSSDIDVFKEFTTLAGTAWSEENTYQYVKSDINKLDFIGIVNDFTDDLLDKIIDVESTFENSAGSFFSLDLETVNFYLITELLDAYKEGNIDFIKKYALT